MRLAAVIALGLVLIGAVFYVFKGGASGPERISLRAGDREIAAMGAKVYAANCASCHGADLEGQPDWRSRDPDGRLPAPPHDETGHTWHHDGDTLFQLTKNGIGQMIGDPDYVSDMPAFGDVLTDKEIIAALSFIKSRWPQNIRTRHDDMENQQ
ncbi:cytochrome c [Oceaniovalibus sp. ACAM 378]|uniref:cytochrome c n=1 Tax=Oceaniovalibus sp. ACAM 378 TaxID=2599923 RepID=UPI00351AFA0C